MSSSKPGAGLALTHTDLKPLLPDEQHRAKAQKCPLPSLPAHQVAFIVSPGNYLCCLESPGGWEGSLVLSTSWSPHSRHGKASSLLSHGLLDHKASTSVYPPPPCDLTGTQAAQQFPYTPYSTYPELPSSLGQFLCLFTSWMHRAQV